MKHDVYFLPRLINFRDGDENKEREKRGCDLESLKIWWRERVMEKNIVMPFERVIKSLFLIIFVMNFQAEWPPCNSDRPHDAEESIGL